MTPPHFYEYACALCGKALISDELIEPSGQFIVCKRCYEEWTEDVE